MSFCYQFPEMNNTVISFLFFVTEHLKEYRHMFDMILEGEKHVAQSKNNFVSIIWPPF